MTSTNTVVTPIIWPHLTFEKNDFIQFAAHDKFPLHLFVFLFQRDAKKLVLHRVSKPNFEEQEKILDFDLPIKVEQFTSIFANSNGFQCSFFKDEESFVWQIDIATGGTLNQNI